METAIDPKSPARRIVDVAIPFARAADALSNDSHVSRERVYEAAEARISLLLRELNLIQK